MQLRVARLCLDCEELHVADICPVCASQRYAYLSPWLPSEERRRWRRPASAPPRPPNPVTRAVRHTIAWLTGTPVEEPRPTPRTRAADHVPHFDFEPTPKAPASVSQVDSRHPHPTKPRS